MLHIQNLDLTEYNSYRIKAVCKNAFFPDSEQDLHWLFTQRREVPKVILGSGHNVILSKEYYDQDFILFSGNYNKVIINSPLLTADAGVTMLELSEKALINSLSGLEIFYDIPSSLGGAIVMNAGASGEEIKDILIKVRYFDTQKNEYFELQRDEINFEYRNSIFQQSSGLIITKAWLKLEPGVQDSINDKMEKVKQLRWEKQPREYPNAGSVFKRPPGHYVGKLIDDLNLRGFTIGGAKISDKHSGFIINTGNASGNDIIDLIHYTRNAVLKHFDLSLEVEQRII